MQRYIKRKDSGFYISDLQHYVLRDDRSQHLHVAPEAQGPKPEQFFQKDGDDTLDIGTPSAPEKRSFKRYSFRANLQEYKNDCVKHASALANRDPSEYNPGVPNIFPTIRDGTLSEMVFEDCKDYLQTHPKAIQNFERRADPEIGQAYLIYNSRLANTIDETTARHHGATVVASAGNDRISSEADASDGGERQPPTFSMYQVVTKEGVAKNRTFFDRFRPVYGQDQAIVGIGHPRQAANLGASPTQDVTISQLSKDLKASTARLLGFYQKYTLLDDDFSDQHAKVVDEVRSAARRLQERKIRMNLDQTSKSLFYIADGSYQYIDISTDWDLWKGIWESIFPECPV